MSDCKEGSSKMVEDWDKIEVVKEELEEIQGVEENLEEENREEVQPLAEENENRIIAANKNWKNLILLSVGYTYKQHENENKYLKKLIHEKRLFETLSIPTEFEYDLGRTLQILIPKTKEILTPLYGLIDRNLRKDENSYESYFKGLFFYRKRCKILVSPIERFLFICSLLLGYNFYLFERKCYRFAAFLPDLLCNIILNHPDIRDSMLYRRGEEGDEERDENECLSHRGMFQLREYCRVRFPSVENVQDEHLKRHFMLSARATLAEQNMWKIKLSGTKPGVVEAFEEISEEAIEEISEEAIEEISEEAGDSEERCLKRAKTASVEEFDFTGEVVKLKESVNDFFGDTANPESAPVRIQCCKWLDTLCSRSFGSEIDESEFEIALKAPPEMDLAVVLETCQTCKELNCYSYWKEFKERLETEFPPRTASPDSSVASVVCFPLQKEMLKTCKRDLKFINPLSRVFQLLVL